LKWPAVVIAAFFVFRSGIQTLMSRIQRAGYGGRIVDFAEPAAIASEQQQQKQITTQDPETQSREYPPPPPSPALRAVEEPIATMIANSRASEDVKRAWLIRGVAIARMERTHEVSYRLIMGSQIEVLLQANSGKILDTDSARAIYDLAKEKYPEIYKTFSFEDWINWPVNAGLLNMERDASMTSVVKITDIGKDFLHYLVGTGLTTPKIG
jgi:hypothetical protein